MLAEDLLGHKKKLSYAVVEDLEVPRLLLVIGYAFGSNLLVLSCARQLF